MTNFQKIKKMTKKQLAEYIRRECCHSCMYGYINSIDNIIKWFEQEVEEE